MRHRFVRGNCGDGDAESNTATDHVPDTDGDAESNTATDHVPDTDGDTDGDTATDHVPNTDTNTNSDTGGDSDSCLRVAWWRRPGQPHWL